MATADRTDTEQLLARGLRNYWYPIAASWMVHRAPVGLTRLGERLVVWRGEDGAPHALEDRCPHRGARLSLGWNLGDSLACWYHGIEVAEDGQVARVPAVDDCPLEGRHCVKSYPCVERAGAIFAWFGDGSNAEPALLDLPEQLVAPEWSSFLCTAHWRCNYRYAYDNTMDPMHGAYLHAASHSMSVGEKKAAMRITDTAMGFRFEKTGQRGINLDWVEFAETGALWMHVETPYRAEAGPGGHFHIIGFVTPVDEKHCRVFFWRCRKTAGWQRDAWRFLYKTRLEGLHWEVLEQDRAMLETMPDDARDDEFLYQHDTAVARLRRLMQERARVQVSALAAPPPSAAD